MALSLLGTLSLLTNQLSGTLPSSWSGMSRLSSINLQNNQLSGTLPTAWTIPLLTTLSLGDNQLEGTLPDQWNISMPRLSSLSLQCNSIVGTLPSSWGSMIDMNELHLGYNLLSGTLPKSWGAMQALNALKLGNGDMDRTAQCSDITPLVGHGNRINGTLPQSWSSLSSVMYLSLEGNQLDGSLPESWSAMSYMINMSFAHNAFTGFLPASWSAMTIMSVLSLNDNRFTGTVPPAWGLMGTQQIIDEAGTFGRTLTLDLSSNCIRGELPPSWTTADHTRGLMVTVSSCFTFLVPSSGGECDGGAVPAECASWSAVSSRSLSLTDAVQPATTPTSTQTHGQSNTLSRATESASLHLRQTATMSPPIETIKSPSVSASTIASIAAATSLSAIAALVSSGDPGSAQALLAAIESPCVCDNAARFLSNSQSDIQSVLPASALVALAPLLSAWTNDVGATAASIMVETNIALTVGVMLLQGLCVGVGFLRRRRQADHKTPPMETNHIMLIAAFSGAHFPSVSIKVAMLFLPGVVWGCVRCMSMMLTDPSSIPTARLRGTSILGILFLLMVVLVIEFVVFRRWILNPSIGPVFLPFTNWYRLPSSSETFSPPIPRQIADVLCSRLGEWGPERRRTSFGAPLVTTFLPKNARWVWSIGPTVSLFVVALSATLATSSTACNAMQLSTIAVLTLSALWFAVATPHRAIVVSMVMAVGLVHTALVHLLGMLCRYELVVRDTVLLVASIGSWVLTAMRICVMLVALWEQHHLTHCYSTTTTRSPLHAAEDAMMMESLSSDVSSMVPLVTHQMFESSITLQHHAASRSGVKTNAALTHLVRLICAEGNDASGSLLL
ncbi:GP46-like surface antigen, putative [Bodo saltans]|uniref:GP46-like surface antigen, putative n=1 Tax=Bodo saltans TaxID=75058 RepID=A0A0S4JF29_BODSA|nr:GP46-like surface antigen, putative [Bodo saltans]|eukprot:CUG88751.1 GP46-like surface antigen, putative [Bodo saltans]